MENKRNLEAKIERLRKKLYQLSSQKAKSKELLEVSQLLDVALNEYERLKIK